MRTIATLSPENQAELKQQDLMIFYGIASESSPMYCVAHTVSEARKTLNNWFWGYDYAVIPVCTWYGPFLWLGRLYKGSSVIPLLNTEALYSNGALQQPLGALDENDIYHKP